MVSGKKAVLPSVVHYLDDFLFVGKAGSRGCQRLLKGFAEFTTDLVVPLVGKKKSPTMVQSAHLMGY